MLNSWGNDTTPHKILFAFETNHEACNDLPSIMFSIIKVPSVFTYILFTTCLHDTTHAHSQLTSLFALHIHECKHHLSGVLQDRNILSRIIPTIHYTWVNVQSTLKPKQAADKWQLTKRTAGSYFTRVQAIPGWKYSLSKTGSLLAFSSIFCST